MNQPVEDMLSKQMLNEDPLKIKDFMEVLKKNKNKDKKEVKKKNLSFEILEHSSVYFNKNCKS